MSTLPKTYITPEQYLELDRQAEFKSEYFAGEMFAMSGAREAHNLIVANVIIGLGSQLRGRPCRVYPPDMRVQVSATGLYTYPDVTVVCGDPQFRDEVTDTLLNPTVIVEVLSKSTESYDRGPKFEHYTTLPSLAAYLLISTDRVSVELYIREPKGNWTLTHMRSLPDEIDLSPIGCRLSLAEIYERLDLPSGVYPAIRSQALDT